jgi:hypothetical protein
MENQEWLAQAFEGERRHHPVLCVSERLCKVGA